MLYGEHLSAEEVSVQCACGAPALTEVFNKNKHSCGWFCRRCERRKLLELRQQAKLARAIVRERKTP